MLTSFSLRKKNCHIGSVVQFLPWIILNFGMDSYSHVMKPKNIVFCNIEPSPNISSKKDNFSKGLS